MDQDQQHPALFRFIQNQRRGGDRANSCHSRPRGNFQPTTKGSNPMSDTIPVQHESAVAVLREMEGEVATKIQSLTDELRLANAQQDTLLNAISKLTRKPRVRKVVPPAE